MPLTKKEREKLKSDKVQIVAPAAEPPQRYTVMMSLTAGELLALHHGMKDYMSPVGADVSMYIQNAMENNPDAKKLLF